MSRAVLLLIFAAASLASRAHAHDPPEISRVYWTAAGPILSTNRGLIFGTPDHDQWRLMCNAAWGTPFGEQPDLVRLGDGPLLAATTRGLQTSTDGGCSWRGVDPFAATAASALAQHPTDPNHLYLALWDAARGGLYESLNAGATWRMLLHIGQRDHIARILLAGPSHLYLSGLVHDDRADRFSFQLTRSSDAGRSWTRSFIPLREYEDEAELLAVNPIHPDTVLVLAKSHDRSADRVLVSRNAGEAYDTLLEAPGLRSATFSADGRLAFVAGDEGFYRSTAELTSAQAIGESQFVSYAESHEDALYLGGNHTRFDPANAGLGMSKDDGMSFQSIMAFTQVREPVACPADSAMARACKPLWIDWQVEVLVGAGGAPLDSIPDWSSFDSAEPEPMSGRPTLSEPRNAPADPAQPSAAEQSPGSCALQHTARDPSWYWLGYCVAVLWRARRRRRTSA